MRYSSKDRRKEAALLRAELAHFEMWLTPDEWAMGRVASKGLVMTATKDDSAEVKAAEVKSFNVAAHLLPLWVRDELSASDVQKKYEQLTGTTLKRPYSEALAELEID